MTYAIVFASQSGNTALIAAAIRSALPEQDCAYYGAPDLTALQADLIFCGFWTDRRSCPKEIAPFLQRLSQKKTALFGTAGFGGQQEYFNRIFAKAAENLPKDARLLGTYMCQGRMQESVRERYVTMQNMQPDDEQIQAMIDNFDRARTHPDNMDIDRAQNFARRMLLFASAAHEAEALEKE